MNKVMQAVALATTLAAASVASAGTIGPTNFNVTVNVTASCSLTAPPTDVAFTYVAFQGTASVASPSSYTVKCTNLRPYNMSLDATSGVVSGLNYTIALSAASGTGTGLDQSYAISGNMVAGQSGTCAGASCTGTDLRTLTVTY